jgi:hypothetical protein
MSIATLKKKVKSQYRNSSVNQPQFSLNGTLRNQGYVGQTSLSRHLIGTPMKGNVIKGHGGCCGTYLVKPVIPPSSTRTLNNSSIVKSSVMTNSGMINTQYRWIRRPQPYATVKPDNNNNLNTQQQYIDNVKNSTLSLVDSCSTTSGNTVTKCCDTGIVSYFFKSYNYNYTPNFVKSDPTKVENLQMSQGDYIQYKLHNNCVKNDVVTVSKKMMGVPFGCKSSASK